MAPTTELIQQLDSSDPALQAQAAEALAQMADEAQPAILALVRHAGSGDDSVAQWCNSALEDVGPPALDQIRDLTALAKSADASVAYWAVTLLGRAGEDATEAVAVLEERVADPSAPQVQKRAQWALDKIRG